MTARGTREREREKRERKNRIDEKLKKSTKREKMMRGWKIIDKRPRNNKDHLNRPFLKLNFSGAVVTLYTNFISVKKVRPV